MTSTDDPFAVIETEVRGVPTRVFAAAPPTLRSVWDAAAAHGDADYLVYDDERLTFADTRRRVAAFAAHLVSDHGVAQGDRVAIAMRNYPEFAVAFWATVSIGAVAVPLNAWWTGPELAYGLSDSGSVVLVADDERVERIGPHLAGTDVRAVVTVRTDRRPDAGATTVGRFEDIAVTDATGAPQPTGPIDPDDDAAIMYTSGTTGRPKGAVQTHRNFVAHMMNALYRAAASAPPPVEGAPPPPSPATLLTFPLFHVGGLQSFLLPYTATGGKVVLMYRWDVARALELIEAEGINALAGVPTTVFELLELARETGKDLSSVAGIASGATLVPPELVRRIDDQLAHRAAPANGYGLTETSGAAVANSGADYVSRPDSVGRPISPVMEVRIVGPDGDDLPTGDVGEIWIKGPTVVRGYFGLPAETAASFTDGWFHTGDLGRLDDEGLLYVVDRLKDVIIRGGENIYAAEVEAAIYEHPDVTEAAIVGLPHERLGEEVGAVVRLRDGAGLTEDGLRAHVAERLAGFKVPARVWLRTDELPRNATGKVLKRELRESLAART
ncbi:MAG: AMP-binding protein [Actinomycetota bacterium]|nr:AMP-binding protein [Actinomycetota bacterium]